MRVVLDANVLVSALLSRIIRRSAGGSHPEDADRFVGVLRALAELVPDPARAPLIRSADSGDDYLLAVAARERAPLVSGDSHLLALGDRLPIWSPRQFLEQLERP